ncbi:hypothetical protein M0805_005776 [Coniferiporia weirii]|nr:hypothetical protein M0805_005776 [Coniferiporia weirii]
MGRWTPRHYDEVLVTKIESLVNGAIRKCKQEDADEKTKVSMTYETFVESLNEEDLFTTSLVEILVRELADRQGRQNPVDKQLINNRTSDSLRTLASSNGIYRGPPYSRLRARAGAAPLSLYDRDPSDSPEEDDFDEFGASDSFGAAEGARIDSALYDVYSRSAAGVLTGPSHPYPPPPGSRAAYQPSTVIQRHLHVPHSQFARPGAGPVPTPPRWASVFSGMNGSTSTTAPPNATSLVRQASMRRPSRSRIALTSMNASSDFRDFAARRRSAQRIIANRDTVGSASPHAHAEGSVPRYAPDNRPVSPWPSSFAVGTEPTDFPRASLFDPPSPSAQATGTHASSPSPSLDVEEPDTQQPYRSSANTLAFLVHGSAENASAMPPNSAWQGMQPTPMAPRIPPLRRGGIRPPESMLSPRASSTESAPTSLLRPEPDGADRLSEPSFGPDYLDYATMFVGDASVASSHEDAGPAASVVVEPPTSLPTPRSISPTDNLAVDAQPQ